MREARPSCGEPSIVHPQRARPAILIGPWHIILRGPSVPQRPVRPERPSRSMSQAEEYPSQFRGLWRSSEARPSSDCLSIHPGPSSEAEAQPSVLRGQSVLQRPIRPQTPVMHPQKPTLRGPPSSAGLSVPQRPGCPLEARPSSQRPIQSSEIRGRLSVLRVQCVLQRAHLSSDAPLHPQKPCPRSPQSPELERPVRPADTCPSSEARPSRRGLSVIINPSRRGPSVLRGSAVKSGVPQKPVRPQKPVNPSWSVTLA